MGKIYTDQTGKFPVLSSRGNKYLFVLYDYDSNAIMAEPIKSRTQSELTRTYKNCSTNSPNEASVPKYNS
jgi:hypothetical protein